MLSVLTASSSAHPPVHRRLRADHGMAVDANVIIFERIRKSSERQDPRRVHPCRIRQGVQGGHGLEPHTIIAALFMAQLGTGLFRALPFPSPSAI